MSAPRQPNPPAADARRRPQDSAQDSYYGQPLIKEPVWTPEVPWYFFTGGLAGASAGLAYLSERRGSPVLARRAWLAALAGIGVSPVLLISDLGSPARFLNMLRMFKVTSPMSVGSWLLAASGAATGLSAFNSMTGRLPGAARVAKPAAAALGLPLSTYTGGLLGQTAVPVWNQARRELPALFGAGAAVSAGAAATTWTPLAQARPARRLAVIGAVAELGLMSIMERRLGELAEPYHHGAAGAYARAALGLTVAGAGLVGLPARRSRGAALAGGAALLAGAFCERWSVFKAGFQSAADPRYTLEAQRRRIAAAGSRRASTIGSRAPRSG